MDLKEIFKDIKKKFSPRKFIDFEKEKLHFEVEPVTSMEEMIIMESIQDLDGAQYIEALKRHTLACALKNINGIEIHDEVKYMDDDGKEKVKSHFLFMQGYLNQFPSPLIETLFEAYSNMVKGLQQKIQSNVKFERVELSEEVEEEVKENFQKIEEGTSEGLTHVERLNKRVEKEAEEAQMRMTQATEEK